MLVRRYRTLALAVALVTALATVPAAETTVTSPKQFFGFSIGDDYQLANYTQLAEYWQKLDGESNRMKVVEIGKTAEERPQLMAIITSPENHKKLDALQGDLRAASRTPRDSPTSRRAQLAREGKAVVWIDGGLHATEVLGAQQLIEMVYQMVSRTDAETMRILNDVIILCVHANPDGMELVSELVHARDGSDEAIARRHPAPLPEVRRPRRQPRLLHVEPGRDDEHEPRDVPRVVPADHVQPSPDRARPAR